MSKTLCVDFINPTEVENEILNQLDDSYIEKSEMSFEERAFLNALLLRNKPKKLLELGVSAGGSSVVILNAIKDIIDARLYSIDLSSSWYSNPSLKTGHLVDNYQNLKSKWELFTGSLAYKFIEKIGSGIDFCLIDTAHANPGEILDFLMILPMLNEDAIVVFHDTNLHAYYLKIGDSYLGTNFITNNLLISSITGKKILQGNFNKKENNYFPNIAGIKINAQTKEYVFEIFNLLTIKWRYLLTQNQENELISFLEKYYNSYYIDYLKDIFIYQKEIKNLSKKTKLKAFIKRNIGYRNISKIKKLLRCN
jgi:predicted O-methyltransferase YrrM